MTGVAYSPVFFIERTVCGVRSENVVRRASLDKERECEEGVLLYADDAVTGEMEMEL